MQRLYLPVYSFVSNYELHSFPKLELTVVKASIWCRVKRKVVLTKFDCCVCEKG